MKQGKFETKETEQTSEFCGNLTEKFSKTGNFLDKYNVIM